jgi:zinc transport system ATP-binding protein
MTDTTSIEFHNVRFCYGEVCAVKGVNFSLPPHRLTVFVGPNGGGKSTLIKLLAGLLKPQEGTITYRKNVEIGYVPQNSAFDTAFPLTVEEMVLQGTLPKQIRPFSRYTSLQKERAADAMRRVGLEQYGKRGVGQLSGGQLQRAVIARTLASSADIVALDEPDACLDVDAARELYDILRTLKGEKTILLASHNIETALSIADRAIYVNKTVREYFSPHALRDELKGGISI